MNTFRTFAVSIFVTILPLVTLIACGGGGGGSSDSGFTGTRAQAVIDDGNAGQLVHDAYNGGLVFDRLVVPLNAGKGLSGPPAPLARVMLDALPTLDFAPTVTPMATTEVVGPCGGTAIANITEGSTSASGTIVYNDYCDGGVTLDGNVGFAASLDTQSNVVSIAMTFGNLTTAEGTLSGSLSMIFNLDDPTAPMTIGMDMVLTDSLDQTFWIDDYTIVITPGTPAEAVDLSGTYHDFAAGYVEITTSETLLIDDATGRPESGTLHFAGADGSWADLTATGDGGYTLTVSTGAVINDTF